MHAQVIGHAQQCTSDQPQVIAAKRAASLALWLTVLRKTRGHVDMYLCAMHALRMIQPGMIVK